MKLVRASWAKARQGVLREVALMGKESVLSQALGEVLIRRAKEVRKVVVHRHRGLQGACHCFLEECRLEYLSQQAVRARLRGECCS
jgi:hypothetical protein